MPTRRRALLLLFVLVTLTLGVALLLPLVLLTSVTAVTTLHESDGLRHRLAAESVLALLPELLVTHPEWRRRLDQDNRMRFDLAVGALRVDVLLQDDSAKWPLPLLDDAPGDYDVRGALRRLQTELGLPELTIRAVAGQPAHRGRTPALHPAARAGCLEDLFTDPDDARLYGDPDRPRTWCQFVTPLGRHVHVRRADPAVLDAALADLQPGLGRDLAQLRRARRGDTAAALLAQLELGDLVRRAAQDRLTDTPQRYSLLIRTTLGADVRCRYLICEPRRPPAVLVDWEVTP